MVFLVFIRIIIFAVRIASASNIRKVSAISSLASSSASSLVDERRFSKKSSQQTSGKDTESDENGGSHAKSEPQEDEIGSPNTGDKMSQSTNEDEGNYSGGSLNESDILNENESRSDPENTYL